MMREVSSLTLTVGGNIVRQGEHFLLGYQPKDVEGNPVNLEGKTLSVAFVKRNQVVYETTAEFDPGDGLLYAHVDQNIGSGEMWLEFTATDPNAPTYRKKFPSSRERAIINVVPGADDIDFVGVGGTTVEQLRTEQATAQQEFESVIVPKVETIETQQAQLAADYQAAAGALTEDSEVILARGDKPTLGARLDDTAVKLADKASKEELQQVSLSYKESYDTLALLQAAYPSGDAYNHAVLADDMIYTFASESWVSTGIQANGTGIADGTITTDKLASDLKRTISKNNKNIYDPSLAVDKFLSSYANGTYAAYDTSAMLGKYPVQAGNVYTISIPETEQGIDQAFRCYDEAGAFIGNSRVVSSNPVAPGASSGTQRTADGRKQVTLTLAADSPVRFVDTIIIFPYATHTTADFDRIRNSIQIEYGEMFTSFEVFGTATPRVTLEGMPESYSQALTDINTLKQVLNGDTTLIKKGNLLEVRTAWNETHDLLQKMEFVENGGFSRNSIFQFTGHGLIPKETPNDEIQYATYTSLKVSTDDTAPLQYNGTFVGASHGAYEAVNLLATAHGKTEVDVGSEWIDSSGRKYYIIRIVDANNIWVLSENVAVDGTWDFDTSVEGTALTHSANATNTAPINFTTKTINQIIQAVSSVSRKLLINNKVPVNADGVYNGKTIEVVESYNIVSPLNLLERLKQKAGSSQPLNFNDGTLLPDARIINTYSFQSNGATTVYSSVEIINQVKIDYFGMVQANTLPLPSGGKIKEYVPKTLPTLAGGVTYDLKNVADVTSLSASIDVAKPSWENADNPPDRFIQLTENSAGNKVSGFGIGYCPEIGIGRKENRKTLVYSAFALASTKKQYPRAVSKDNAVHTNRTIPADSFFEGVAFRVPVNYSLYPDATNVSWYEVGNAVYLMLDFHSNVSKTLQLPDDFLNRKIEVVEKTSSFNLLSSFVNMDGIKFKVTEGYGYAILKLV